MKKRVIAQVAALGCLMFADVAAEQTSLDQQPSCWIEADYLLWFIKKNPLPVPLLTTASFADPLPGAIGQKGTHVKLGRDHVHMGWMNGFRVGVGGAVSPHFEMEGSYFLLPTVSKKRSFRTSGEPGSRNFAVPIFDVTGVCGLKGVPGETIFILPGPLDGDPGFFGKFDLRLTSRLQGAEAIGLYQLFEGESFHLQGLGGFRWLQLHESLLFKAKTHSIPGVPFPPGFFNFSDRFSTWNNFLGAEFGIGGKYLREKWKLEGKIKGALGAVLEQVKIHGTSRTSGGNLFFETKGTANQTLPGGIFAQPTNRGRHNRNAFAYAFEARIDTGYNFTRNLSVDLGYTFLWLSQVLRPGKQIDRKINTTLTALADASRKTVGTGPGPIPFGDSAGAPAPRGSKKPRVPFKTSSFYAQGLEVGVTVAF